ncbi:MAG: asparagine--tRNA ligase [Calditrichia bacterium]
MEKNAWKKKVDINKVHEYVGQEIIIAGWLYNKRSSGKIQFLLVRDGSEIIQCVVVKSEVPDEIFQLYEKMTLESALVIKGVVNEDKRSPLGYELLVRDIEIIHIADEYPITKKEHGIDFLMEWRHLWIRSKKQNAILKVRHEIIRAIRDFFNSRDFVLFDPPIFTPNACEGTTNLFEVDYFDDKVYLTQSGQLYGEAGAMAFGKIYTFGPTFRAEKSKTRRHLTEFWMIEPEVAFADLDDVMQLAEDMLVFIVQRVLETRRRELETLERDISVLEKVTSPFPRISYDEAVEILHKNGKEFTWGDDFGGEDETIISSQFDRPVMVHRYPAEVKAFYMKRDPENEKVALAVDVLAPEGYGEIVGGSQREDDYDTLVQRIKEHDLPLDFFKWYLDLRKYGSVPHGGFGLGLERTVAWITGIKHIREAIPFPRTIYRVEP